MIGRAPILLPDAAAAEAIGRALATSLGAGDVVTLSGPLGAGKTTLARGLLAGLGLAGEAPSPTFPLVIAYAPPEVRLPVWHADLYRIQDPAEVEALDLGYVLEDGALLIEWPERLGARGWPQALQLALAPDEHGGRCLTAGVPPAWESRWPPR